MGFLDELSQRLYNATKRQYLEMRYGAPWPYPDAAGVGLHITNIQLDAQRFVDAIRGAGCPTNMAIELAGNLALNGEIKTTISQQVDLLSAIDDIKKSGAAVQVIAPAQKYINGLHHESV